MSEETVQEILDTITELQEDNTVPRNVKLKLENIEAILKENADVSVRVNKALHILEDIGEDINMESYTRTQIWNLASMLEKL